MVSICGLGPWDLGSSPGFSTQGTVLVFFIDYKKVGAQKNTQGLACSKASAILPCTESVVGSIPTWSTKGSLTVLPPRLLNRSRLKTVIWRLRLVGFKALPLQGRDHWFDSSSLYTHLIRFICSVVEHLAQGGHRFDSCMSYLKSGLCRYSTTVSAPACQAGDVSSILIICSMCFQSQTL